MEKKIKNWDEFLNEDIEHLKKLGKELDADPKYMDYQTKYIRNKLIKDTCAMFGPDPNNVPQEIESMVDAMLPLIAKSAEKSSDEEFTEDYIKQHKQEIIDITNAIMDMTTGNEDYEISGKLKKYREELDKY